MLQIYSKDGKAAFMLNGVNIGNQLFECDIEIRHKKAYIKMNLADDFEYVSDVIPDMVGDMVKSPSPAELELRQRALHDRAEYYNKTIQAQSAINKKLKIMYFIAAACTVCAVMSILLH